MLDDNTVVTHHTDSRTNTAEALLAAAYFAGVAVAVSVLGSVATSSSTDSTWFEELDKPSFYPPSATFGIVWTILYVIIAVSGWLAWRGGAPFSTLAVWTVQMGFNLAWSVVFFGLREPTLAVVVIVVLTAAIIETIRRFHPVHRLAAWMLIPYLAWVGFATVLNVSIAIAN